MNKRIFALLLILTLLTFSGASMTAYGEAEQSNESSVIVYTLGRNTILRHDRTFIPLAELRALVTSLGGSYNVNSAIREVRINYNNTILLFNVGSNIARVNNNSVQIDENPAVFPFMENNTGWFPLRFTAETLGMNVEWHEATSSVQISVNRSLIVTERRPVSPDTSHFIAITDMEEGTYHEGFPGMLYDGSNTPPDDYLNFGLRRASEIKPLDRYGNEDENGRIVFLSIGMSNTSQSFSVFRDIVRAETSVNPRLTIVDGAIGGQTIPSLLRPETNYWNDVNERLARNNVSAQQVQIVWVKQAFAQPTAVFPQNALDIKEGYRAIIDVMLEKYPNLKMIYLSSRTYGGYAVVPLNPEPHAYEAGFGVKWLVEEFIEAYREASNPDMPYVAWGPYLWANGETPRNDGFYYTREDFVEDGTHPSMSGRRKVAGLMLEFLRTDLTAREWFLE